MATAVISGRVDESVVRKADAHIRMAGLTPGAIIKTVWENIAKTGEVPQPIADDRETDDAWDAFFSLRDSLPKSTWLGSQTDEQMKAMIAGRYA